MIAIIGGSGLARFPEIKIGSHASSDTPYGQTSAAPAIGTLADCPVVFLPRHGERHTVAPHLINYRANIWALKQLGVCAIISIASVGGIRPGLNPGTVLLPDQIIDYTWGRHPTFFDVPDQPVHHIDFTNPFDITLRKFIHTVARSHGQRMSERGVYACTQGPRLETAAEIDRLERDGADMVGMTGMPEAILAREMNIPYAALAVVVNHAAGRGESRDGIAMDEIAAVFAQTLERVRGIVSVSVQALTLQKPLATQADPAVAQSEATPEV